jgi:hypothetical protein
MARPSKEYQAFTSTVDQLLTVSKEELDRRVAAYKAEADKNPNKRGPKPKVKASASRASGASTPRR